MTLTSVSWRAKFHQPQDYKSFKCMHLAKQLGMFKSAHNPFSLYVSNYDLYLGVRTLACKIALPVASEGTYSLGLCCSTKFQLQ
jgi:hypothetical protein